MATVERTYNIPLRKEFQKAPKYKRAKKAVTAVREYLQKHMKTQDVRLGVNLNMEVWKDGIKNPPHHIKVNATKNDDGVCKAELFGHKFIEKKAIQPKKKKARGLAGKLAEKMDAVKDVKADAKAEKKEEVKAPEPKAEVKVEDAPKPEVKPKEVLETQNVSDDDQKLKVSDTPKEEVKVEDTTEDKSSEPQKQVSEKKE